MDGESLLTPTFRTPARILIPKLVVSRDQWKAKAGKRKGQLKLARNRVRDLEVSRKLWQERSREAERQVAELQNQVEQTQRELETARGEAERLRDELKKK